MRRIVLLALLVSSCAITANDVTITDLSVLCISPPFNNFSIGPRPFVYTMEIENTVANVVSVVFTTTGPTGITKDCIDTTGTLISGSTYSWSCTVVFPRYSSAGNYILTRVGIRDNNGVLTNIYVDEMDADPDIGVQLCPMISTTPSPSNEIGTVRASPFSVNGVAGETVQCEVPQSGGAVVVGMRCSFKDPSGDLYICSGSSDTCQFDIEPAAEQGYWLLDEVSVKDNLGNRVTQDRTEVISGSTTVLDVNSTGGQGGAGGAPPGYDFCGQIADTTIDAVTWHNDQQLVGSGLVKFNIVARADGDGSFVGVGDSATNNLANFAAAVEFYDTGSEKYFRVLNNGVFVDPNVTLNWTLNSWYKIRIEADLLQGTYYAEVASCSGGDDYYWLGSNLPLQGSPTSLEYIKAYGNGAQLQLHTKSWNAFPDCWSPDCTGGTLAVDTSSIPAQCGTVQWDITPGGYSGTSDFGPTAVADQQYKITWPYVYECAVERFFNEGYPWIGEQETLKIVYNDDLIFTPTAPPPGSQPYVALAEAQNAAVTMCVDGDCLSPPTGFTWSIEADAPFQADYSDSGTDNAGLVGVYEKRSYTVTCNARSGYDLLTPTVTKILDEFGYVGTNVFFCQWNTQ